MLFVVGLMLACTPSAPHDAGDPDATRLDEVGDAPDVRASMDSSADDRVDSAADTPGDGGGAQRDTMPACDAGRTGCGGACVDTTADASNCGACGHACPGGVACVHAVCQCPTGMAACGSFCIDVTTDPNHCGACASACGANSVCASGACLACSVGLTACNNACTDTNVDVTNCGACFARCGPGYACTSGTCTCASGRTVCGATCSDTSRDDYNCGSCGAGCGAGTRCVSGLCAPCAAAGSPSFARDVQPILTTSCALAGCHSGIAPAHGLTLESGLAYAALVDVPGASCGASPYVAPGDVSQSVILFAIAGGGPCPVVPMPFERAPLNDADVDVIRGWVCSGAQP